MASLKIGLLLLLLHRFSRVQLCATPYTAAHQASCPWDSPGKNTSKVKSPGSFPFSTLTLMMLATSSHWE